MLVDGVAWCPVPGTVDVVVVEVGAAVLVGTLGVTVGAGVVDVFAAVVDVAARVDVGTVPAVVDVDVVEVVAGDQVVVVLHGVVDVDGDPLQPVQRGFAWLLATQYPLSCWLQFGLCGWGPGVVAPGVRDTERRERQGEHGNSCNRRDNSNRSGSPAVVFVSPDAASSFDAHMRLPNP
jgi:hypothetical protein